MKQKITIEQPLVIEYDDSDEVYYDINDAWEELDSNIDSELTPDYFQVVVDFINKEDDIKSFDLSSIEYLETDLDKDGNPISRAEFTIEYVDGYDEDELNEIADEVMYRIWENLTNYVHIREEGTTYSDHWSYSREDIYEIEEPYEDDDFEVHFYLNDRIKPKIVKKEDIK